jgi:hypothetical protein
MTMGRSQRCTAITLMGTGEFQSKLEGAGIASGCKTQSPSAAGGLFTKDRFNIDLGARTVTCPNNVTVPARYNWWGGRLVPWSMCRRAREACYPRSVPGAVCHLHLLKGLEVPWSRPEPWLLESPLSVKAGADRTGGPAAARLCFRGGGLRRRWTTMRPSSLSRPNPRCHLGGAR